MTFESYWLFDSSKLTQEVAAMDLDDLLGIDRDDLSVRLADHLVAQDEALLDQLIDLRHRANLSQKDVAERLGITQSAIAKFESGERDPRLSTLRRYALAVGASVTHAVDSYKPYEGAQPATRLTSAQSGASRVLKLSGRNAGSLRYKPVGRRTKT